jgi:hypothetical protein
VIYRALWYNIHALKTLRFIPLTFLAGIHGFPMFITYLLVIGAIAGTIRFFR